MPVRIIIPKDVQALFDINGENLIVKVRREFGKLGPAKFKQAMNQDMIKGISPVKGEGKWKRYSKGYQETIRGEATYFKKDGKIIRVGKTSGRTKASASAKAFIAKRHKEFQAKAAGTKNISPVNLRYTGKLHKDLKVYNNGVYNEGYAMIVEFDNPLADVHNRLGAGKSKVVRRMLPTENNEEFNLGLTAVILDNLRKAVAAVVSSLPFK